MSQEYTKPGRVKNQGTQFLVVTQHNLISTFICQSQITGSYRVVIMSQHRPGNDTSLSAQLFTPQDAK